MGNTITVLVLLLCTITYTTAQSLRTAVFGGRYPDAFTSVVALSDGGYCVAGTTSSHDGDAKANSTGQAIWIQRLDSNFKIVWQRFIGCSRARLEHSFATSLVETADHGLVVVGYSYAFDGHFNEMNKGQSDVFVLKYDSLGKLVYKKMIGGYDIDVASSACALPSGSVVIAGSTHSRDGDFERNQRYSNGIRATDEDAFVMCLDTRGSIIWTRIYSGSRDESVSAVRLKNDSTLMLVGSTNSTDDDFSGVNHWPHSSSTVFAMELKHTGTELWIHGYGSDHVFSATATDIAVHRDGSIYITGNSQGSFDNFRGEGGLSTGYEDLFVLRTSSKGVEEWVRRYDKGQADEGNCLTILSDGTIAVSGFTHPQNQYQSGTFKKDADALVAIFDQKGTLVDSKVFGGRGWDIAASHTVNRHHRLVVVGSTLSDRGDPHNDGVFLNLGKSASYDDAFIIELE